MKKCPNCKVEVEPGAIECSYCGKALVDRLKYDCVVVDNNGRKLKMWFEGAHEDTIRRHLEGKGWHIESLKPAAQPFFYGKRKKILKGVLIVVSIVLAMYLIHHIIESRQPAKPLKVLGEKSETIEVE